MARGKAAKKNSLSVEERLEQALVPAWEQPYKVPSNWVWTYANSMFRIEYGKGLSTKELTDNGYPVFGANGYIGYFKNYMFETEQALMSCRGAYSGKMNLSLPFSFITNNSLIIASYSDIVASKFIYYLFSALNKSKIISGSAQPQVTVQAFNNFAVPLPPLAEQQRIVDRIESLFAKLDEAKEKVQAALDSFEHRKAAILHQAFTGELTKKWREENGVGLDSWSVKEFSQVAEIKSNLVAPIDYPHFPHIAPDNIEKKTGVLLAYKTIAEDGVTSGKHRFYSGQILYSKIRPYLSKVVIVDFDGLCSADMYPIEAKGNTKYLWYFMLSESFLVQASNAGSRSVLPKINQKEMSTISIAICTLPEQTEIVHILDSLFAKEQKTKELANVVEKIELMKKAILARAFRGELGTNDPKEENATELLKNIILEKISSIKVADFARVIESVQIEKVEGKEVAKSILDALQENKELTPEQLKTLTELEIDVFYEKLKELVNDGKVIERRENGESFLEVVHAS